MQIDSTQRVTYSRDSSFTASWGANHLNTNKSADTLHQNFTGTSHFPDNWSTQWVITPGVSHTILTAKVSGRLSFFDKIKLIWKGKPETLLSPYYEESLHELNTVLNAHQKEHKIEPKGLVEISGKYYVFKRNVSPVSRVYQTLTTLFEEVYAEMKSQELYANGKPFALFSDWDESGGIVTVSACVPVSSRCELANDKGILCDYLSEGIYFNTILKGNYTYLEAAWDETEKTMIQQSVPKDPSRPSMEIYLVDGSDTYDISKYITELYYPVLPKDLSSFAP